MKASFLLMLGLFSASALTGLEQKTPNSVDSPASEFDRNGDGKIDYRVYYGERGAIEREELDFNYDGRMDDFCYYKEGILDREEIDSDFNGAVDIWVYLHQGIYIARYEMDRDGDGKPDYTKSFGGN